MPSICEVGGGGNVLPLMQSEQEWPHGLRGFLYLLGLGWCFMGVALIADVFMGAIEKITSKKVVKKNWKTGRNMTEMVWNPTVANLTLMALGSSAPEILLALIELVTNDFFSGDLGPSTIVGSAAFNLFCITAVCVVSIPDGEVRYIKEVGVYSITASFSVFAYVWLLIILKWTSENVVEVWEGVVTLILFPILVYLAFLADIGYFSCSKGRRPAPMYADQLTKEDLAEMSVRLRKQHTGRSLSDEEVQQLIEIECSPKVTRAQYRVAATRRITAGRPVSVKGVADLCRKSASHLITANSMASVLPLSTDKALDEAVPPQEVQKGSVFDFEVSKYACIEDVGAVVLTVIRQGNLTEPASVLYKTCDGTAKSEADYMPLEGRAEFASGVEKATIEIKIIDDASHEENEEFYVDLAGPEQGAYEALIGERGRATVVIIDNDHPGVLDFTTDTLTVTEQAEDFTVGVTVERKDGSCSRVGCKFRTEEASALNDRDFEATEGCIEFEGGQLSSVIPVTIKAAGRYERAEMFRLILSDPFGGVMFDPQSDGGADCAILTILIQSADQTKARVDKLMTRLQSGFFKAEVGHANWRDQFIDAIFVNGGRPRDGEDENSSERASILEYVMHFVLLPWKLLFALVPPTDYAGGWLCFWFALIMIGVVTALIGDMAGLLGCVMGLRDEITAITFVALGTSLPDTFASKAAATQDPHADASIGNVTGSNSVNVFLGLGLPWMVGSIYWTELGPNAVWKSKYSDKVWAQDWLDGALIVESGNLGFSVAVYSICAAVCIFVLFLRRMLLGGELGGPKVLKYATAVFFVSLWIVYISLSSWYVMNQG